MTGLHSRFLSAFASADGKRRVKSVNVEKITLMFDEESLKKRVLRVKGMQRQTEVMLMCTRNFLSFAEKERKHFRGSNKGDALGPVSVPDWAKAWALSFGTKKVLYGPNRVAVGGKSDEGVDDEDEEAEEDFAEDAADRDLIPPALQQTTARKTRDDESIEPVFYQSMFSPTFYAELIHSYNLKLIIHLTAGDGNCADACMEAKIGYVGVVFSDEHLNCLTEHLTKLVHDKLGDTASTLFQPSFASGSGSQTSNGTDDKLSSAPMPKPMPKPKPGKKKQKKGKKERDSSSSASSSAESGTST